MTTEQRQQYEKEFKELSQFIPTYLEQLDENYYPIFTEEDDIPTSPNANPNDHDIL